MKKNSKLLMLTLLLVCGGQLAKAQKVGMFIGYDNVNAIEDDDEKAAAEWFNTNYVANGSGEFFTPSTISSLDINKVKAMWVAIDRVGLTWNTLPDAFGNESTLTTLSNYVKAGGNLLLTNHATMLVSKMGRVDETPSQDQNPMTGWTPTIYGNGEGGSGTDVWGIGAVIGSGLSDEKKQDHRGHAIYNGLSTLMWNNQYEYFALIGEGTREDHNCMWKLSDRSNGSGGYFGNDDPAELANFEANENCTVLGTWQQITDYYCAAVVEFHAKDDWKGSILAIGAAAYEFNQNSGTNTYQSNIEKLTSNSLDYLKVLGNTKASITAPITVDGTESYWGTFYSSSAKTLPEGVSAYTVETSDNGYAKLEKVAEGGQVIPANQGFLLNSATAQDELYLTTANASDAVNVGSNLLKGSDEEATFTDEGTYYILGRTGTEGNYTYGLYWQNGTEGASVKNAANKAFLFVPTSDSQAKAISLTFGEATGISQVESTTNVKDAETYNVAGQRVGASYKGIVIKNGKKYILK